jgi:hypothetical protein
LITIDDLCFALMFFQRIELGNFFGGCAGRLLLSLTSNSAGVSSIASSIWLDQRLSVNV